MTSVKPKNIFFEDYGARLSNTISETDWSDVAVFAAAVLERWKEKKAVFLCGNGGSAGNAIHLANDLLYGISKKTGGGLSVHALSANPAVLTC